jgi:ankyrin repeat protein
MQIRLDIETMSAVTSQSTQDHMALQNKFMSSLAGVDDRIARVEEMLRAQADQAHTNQFKQVGPLHNVSADSRRRSSPSTKQYSTNCTRSEGLGVRVTPYTVACRSGCPCNCHLQQKSSSPALFNRVLGQLFVGYAGLPVLSPKCDNDACQKSRASQISMEYWFPLGFFSSTIVRMQLGYQPNIGTLFQLDTMRRVPDTAQCVNFALNGDIQGLNYLFSRGLASPRDVSSTRGYSLLRWAMYGKQYEACEFLVYAGADPDYRPIAASDNNPRNKACHFLLEGGLSDTAVGALQALTKGSHFEDFVEEARFTQTHRIVLGLSMLSLEEEIILHPEDIDAVDAMGRTSLAWAAARGDRRAVVTLLSHGANPNITDVQLSSAVSNAAAQGHTVCVRLLLEAGGHPDPPLPSGIKKGSPLTCAARNATDLLLLKTLLDFGADVDSAGTDGKTALIHAARTDNASFVVLLLEYGADINATSESGSTPLTTAITYNSHNVLRLILDRWHEYSDCPRLKGPHLLQIAALYADLETMSILAATDHFRMKYDQHYTLGDFQSRLRQRPDLTDKLALAFDDLLSIINLAPDPREGTESLLESGFLSGQSTRVNSDMQWVDKEQDAGCSVVSSRLASRLMATEKRLGEDLSHEGDNDDDDDGDDDDDSNESFADALDGLDLATNHACTITAGFAL